MTLDAPPQPASTMRWDLICAYSASGAKILSWATVTAIVVRYGRAENLAILTLVRSTIGLLAFATLGFAPAMIRMIAEARRIRPAPIDETPGRSGGGVLEYASATRLTRACDPATTAYANGLLLALLLSLGAALALAAYVVLFDRLHQTPEIPRLGVIREFVAAMGAGLICRLLSDAPGARIQAMGLIWLDNLLLAGAEVLWAYLTWDGRLDYQWTTSQSILLPGNTFFYSGVALLAARLLVAAVVRTTYAYRPAMIRWSIMRSLLGFGMLVSIAQLADFLYAPVDYILINRLLDPVMGTYYAPAVQIDAALLVLVTAIANVLLPRTAIAHTGGELATVRRYYWRGTLASLAILLAAAVAVLLTSRWIFGLWLGDADFPTRAILPLVLVHTIVGGSSAVGRSILLGMGKVKPFTVAVLIAGVSNVALSFCFVRFLGLGLNGIVLGTIIAVVGRCAIWQPWYVWRTLHSPETRDPKPETRGL